jgi:GT2 family glycosyltransferase
MNPLQSLIEKLSGAFKATVVIVLYEMTPERSPAYRSLIQASARLPSSKGRVSVVLWDNSLRPQLCERPVSGVGYIHDPRNPGLAAAYNQVLAMAAAEESDWLITLDQDTTVPCDYLTRLAEAARLYEGRCDVGAIVPQITIGKKQVSPYYFAWGCLPRWHGQGYRGIPAEPVFAFNSGAMIRISALQQIGGYTRGFPIEYSDTAMFHKLHQHGKGVYICGDIQLRHEFSLIDMNRLLSAERYRRTLLAESAFWDVHMSRLAGAERTLRLLLRMVRHWVRNDRRDLRQVTLQFVFLRLFRSRRFRLRKWEQNRLEMHDSAPQQPARQVTPRPKVSECMAAYNGSRFIEAQLRSILPQLDDVDEIVIVDDGSSDSTIARIASIRDPRIRLFVHKENQGIVATFEDALRTATGDILFLCDDDDLWASNKVERLLAAFEKNPDAQIVTSRVALIDELGLPLPDARVNRYGRFFAGFWRNIFQNYYQGSAMAIRASLLGRVLPFPRGKQFLHDVWIGTRNEVTGGQAEFVDEPLVYYRRHSNNAGQRHNLLRLIKVRVDLLMAHIAHAL